MEISSFWLAGCAINLNCRLEFVPAAYAIKIKDDPLMKITYHTAHTKFSNWLQTTHDQIKYIYQYKGTIYINVENVMSKCGAAFVQQYDRRQGATESGRLRFWTGFKVMQAAKKKICADTHTIRSVPSSDCKPILHARYTMKFQLKWKIDKPKEIERKKKQQRKRKVKTDNAG